MTNESLVRTRVSWVAPINNLLTITAAKSKRYDEICIENMIKIERDMGTLETINTLFYPAVQYLGLCYLQHSIINIGVNYDTFRKSLATFLDYKFYSIKSTDNYFLEKQT